MALFTASNLDFLHYIKTKKDLFNKGKVVVVSDLMVDIQKQYINNKEEYNCGNPKDNTILTLTTKLTHLENKLEENQPISSGGRREGPGGHSSGDNGDKSRNGDGDSNDLLKWHSVKTEEKITCDGQDWVWCPDHYKEDMYDGI
eukprot:2231864-Ditylum_brightwellii.AAC.1